MGKRVTTAPLPPGALLARYADRDDCYTDCFTVTVDGPVDLPAYVEAFYTAWLFRIERQILGLAGYRSTDVEARALARSGTDRFAAWTVEDRSDSQLLMCDPSSATRSWLAVAPDEAGTRLYFGSAIVPPEPGRDLGTVYRALLGFHKLYSRALLATARARVIRTR
ncbi:hypothetical protein [Pseudaestuariivita atlantica]|uniref:DUF2867 domain-containing protein n=1 Tax=Pseudaestuariivita atlantica TaxID=1317121 RepID=A0A0L1JM76_9RHOB|nr:hypothetical protein [Pseudaestuariivita atlantica]KNG92861.1 hypothetical protein ATO11_15475 [Pseudaestuariivita atlantica]